MSALAPTIALDLLYVVVLNWNLPADTIACVRSLQAELPTTAQILIVDNHSSDDSVAQFRAAFADTVHVLVTPANLGFAGGMNAGIRAALDAGADAVLLLNNDTVVDSAMLAELLHAAHARPQAGVLGPAIFYYDHPTRIWQLGSREYPLLPIPMNLGMRDLHHAAGRPFRLDYVTGCAMFVRRHVFEQVGLLDTSYVMYYEDADFCRRVRQAGYEIWCVPQARMWHRVSLSAGMVKPASRYAWAWGRARFYRQHPHGVVPGLGFVYLLMSTLIKSVGDLLRGDHQLTALLWRGTFDGYALRPVHGPVPGQAEVPG
ncbi:glycosyl transferase family protein [Oscillochloris trichoides DG-6]|uniref:Glycosyl transferase family protein n=1 Tax=Oscillochloris trichoides DG-6 TaxID=765420 RepID=E1IIQ5_9CHLR|nr:glycosyltransferase family 2 protein [Oscillochloris trichoides]EFO78911.1 glycosyl transferase family protein [Oscillochloris trichoides DG-6]